MNNRPDPRQSFDPESTPPVPALAVRSWMPQRIGGSFALSHSYWQTRGARGFSWHRSGRVSQEPLR